MFSLLERGGSGSCTRNLRAQTMTYAGQPQDDCLRASMVSNWAKNVGLVPETFEVARAVLEERGPLNHDRLQASSAIYFGQKGTATIAKCFYSINKKKSFAQSMDYRTFHCWNVVFSTTCSPWLITSTVPLLNLSGLQ